MPADPHSSVCPSNTESVGLCRPLTPPVQEPGPKATNDRPSNPGIVAFLLWHWALNSKQLRQGCNGCSVHHLAINQQLQGGYSERLH